MFLVVLIQLKHYNNFICIPCPWGCSSYGTRGILLLGFFFSSSLIFEIVLKQHKLGYKIVLLCWSGSDSRIWVACPTLPAFIGINSKREALLILSTCSRLQWDTVQWEVPLEQRDSYPPHRFGKSELLFRLRGATANPRHGSKTLPWAQPITESFFG